MISFLKRRPEVLLLLAIFILIILQILFFNKAIIDDSFISFRYAENLANSGELNWNVGEMPPVEGYSNFFWVLILAAVKLAGGEVVVYSKILGALFAIGSIFTIYFLAKKITENKLLRFFPPLFLSVTIPFSFWSVSGMETSLFIFMLLVSVYFFYQDILKNTIYSAIPFTLLSFIRHEGAIIFAVSALFRGVYSLLNKKANFALLIKYVLAFAIPYGVYFFWRLHYYGEFFPNTFYAKKAIFGGIGDILFGLVYMFPIILLFILICAYEKRFNFFKIYLLVIITAILLPLINVHTMTGCYFRFMLPAFPLFYLLVLPKTKNLKIKNRTFFIALSIVLILYVLLFGIFPHNTFKSNPFEEASNRQQTLSIYTKIGKWLQGTNLLLASGDAGAIPYYSRLNHIDLLALNDRTLSRNANDVAYVLNREPDILLLGYHHNTFQTEIYKRIYDSKQFKEKYVLFQYCSPYLIYLKKEISLKTDLKEVDCK